MRLIRSRHLLTFIVAGLTIFAGRLSALEIQKLIPFAWTNSVRVEAVFASNQGNGPIKVSADILDSENHPLWSGTFPDLKVLAGGVVSVSQTITNLRPKLWSPSSPHLYKLKVTAQHNGETNAMQAVRFGFRSFENRSGQFALNGRRIFLRGVAINPPGRTIPDEVGNTRVFAESYVRYLKDQHVNAIRLPEQSQVWFDVCDELGMMLFQGNYGSPLETKFGKKAPPADYDASLAAYKELFATYARHPSIVISILCNELPTSGNRGKAFHGFLSWACDDLKRWDSTRLYIGNAGYGEGREGDVKDAHRYWGWYYNTFLTYYNLRNKNLFGDPKKNQPITFTECVGNYTGPRGDYNVFMNRQLAAQLNWTGHSTDQIDDSLDYQRFMVKQATESFRRLREQNKHLCGIMPFTTFFFNWSGIAAFEQMRPKPAMEQLATSYSPVLLSWEMWTPNIYAGTSLTAYAHIVNDDDAFRDLQNATLIAEIREKGNAAVVVRREFKMPTIRYYKTWRKEIEFHIPSRLVTGDYIISGRIVADGETVTRNETPVFIAAAKPDPSLNASVLLFDPSGQTASALRGLHISFETIRDFKKLSESNALIIGEKSLGLANAAETARLKDFVLRGGRVLILKQDPKRFDTHWLPESIQFFKASANDSHYPPIGRPFLGNMNINSERPDHPVFDGLNRQRLSLWSDYTKWNQRKAGFPEMYPVTAGFRLKRSDALECTAILANYDRGLEGIALCEMFSGKGSFVVSAFDLVHRAGLDPCADRLLANLVCYVAMKENHQRYPLIESSIFWGNYGSERGLVPGSLNGLAVNTEWLAPPTNPLSRPASQDGSGWSTHPGDQFVPRGRIPAGPFGYSNSTAFRDLNPQSSEGHGVVFLRLPEGKKFVRTKVLNPEKIALPFEVFVGAQTAGQMLIEPNKETTINSPLPVNAEAISLGYKGSKKLVILETHFD